MTEQILGQKFINIFLTFAVPSAILATALVSPVLAAPGDFVGTWVNTNPNTRSTTRLVITSDGSNALNIQLFGKCHPTDCDWGRTTLVTYGGSASDADHHFATANYNLGFAKTLCTLSLLEGNQISLQRFTQFLDGSQRQNYSLQEAFKRQE